MSGNQPAWDGDEYDRISAPHAAMGASALERLALDGHERVLDAGCGSGRLTERLLERVPLGNVVALDHSTSMLERAGARLERFGRSVTFACADLGSPPLPVDGQFDAILSTATFHWVPDHDALFAGLAAVLRSGGQLSAQCGGEGNFTAIIEAARAEGVETSALFHFAGVRETLDRLSRSGFADAQAWLVPETISFDDRDDAIDYVVAPYLRPATGLPEIELRELGSAVVDRLGKLAIDYVRLNINARRE